MVRVKYRVLVPCFLVILLVGVGASSALCQTPLESDLPNFGQVTGSLYRGGQPSLNGLATLRTMGVGLVINFRQNRAETAVEKGKVESLGMEYIGIPWGANDDPSSTQVAEFLEAIRVHPGTKIFVHCKQGADRTGVMVAAYRIAVEQKRVADAMSEMHHFHFDGFWHPHLARYVESLPYRLQNEQAFKSLASVQRSGTLS